MLDPVVRLFMEAWYRSREGALEAVAFPQDAPVSRVPGPDQARILLLGNGAASGWGVRSHDLALPGRIARVLADTTGRGIQVDARVDRLRRLRDLDELVTDRDLQRYDAIVLLAGMNDAVTTTPIPEWERSMRHLVERFRRAAPEAGLLVLGPQPVPSVSTYTGWPSVVAERHRLRMNAATRSICAASGVLFDVLPAPARPPGEPGHRSPEVYLEWATCIAALVSDVLPTAGPARAQQDEALRQRATEAMVPDAPPHPRLDRVTRLARSTFGVRFAAVSLLDGEWHRNRSGAGSTLDRAPRMYSMCDFTIRSDGPLVIPDLAADRRFDGNPAVHGPWGLRFYAGYPIESPDGYRVGALCVLDTRPRDTADVDVDALSDLALLAQKELWASVGLTGTAPAAVQ